MNNMKTFLILLSVCCIYATGNTQALKKYPISNSGCSIYNYCAINYQLSKSQDSSQIYTGECKKDDITYGVICVKLINPVTEMMMAEDLIISYADYLKESFKITKASGYGRGHMLDNNEKTRGIVDYWSDAEDTNWKIKAWTDGKFIGFLFVQSKKPLTEGIINVFLDSFKFPDK